MSNSSQSSEDHRWMRSAVVLSRYGLGRTMPNPSVGCVIVKDGALLGRGRTSDGGRPHAETMALAEAGGKASGATAYVTLEPCCHHGETPPCVEQLVKARIARVVVAIKDSDSRVAGKGITFLKEAGIAVDVGVGESEAEDVLAGYLKLRQTGLPLVTVKIASTLDGRIALADGRSKWITSERTRAYVHQLRSQHDSVMTASGTARADNPSLTCRLEGYEGKQPLRVVMASGFDLDPESNLVTSATKSAPVMVIGKGEPPSHQGDTSPNHVDYVAVKQGEDGQTDIESALKHLGGMGVSSVLVEAGGRFLSSLLKNKLIDKLIWTRSQGVIGGDGLASLAELGLDNVADGRLFTRLESMVIDDDMVEIFRRQ